MNLREALNQSHLDGIESAIGWLKLEQKNIPISARTWDGAIVDLELLLQETKKQLAISKEQK